MNAEFACEHRPRLMLRMMEIIATWSGVESQIGTLLTSMLRSDAVAVAAELATLSTTTKRKSFLLEKSKAHLPQDQFESLEILLSMFATDHMERNKLAHWHVGAAACITDGILLQPPKESWKIYAQNMQYAYDVSRAFSKWRIGDPHPQKPPPPSSMDDRDETIYVYNDSDFDRIKSNMSELGHGFSLLSWVVSDGPHKAQEFARLCSLPRYQQHRERLHKRQNTHPSGLAALWNTVRQHLSRWLATIGLK